MLADFRADLHVHVHTSLSPCASATSFTMATVSIAEMRKALRGNDGRKIMME
jgi:hypothetical protein